jgi:hypothetical protein
MMQALLLDSHKTNDFFFFFFFFSPCLRESKAIGALANEVLHIDASNRIQPNILHKRCTEATLSGNTFRIRLKIITTTTKSYHYMTTHELVFKGTEEAIFISKIQQFLIYIRF